MASMRKFIEDLHISVNEKDAEIIKLKMHLGDERNKVAQEKMQMRKTASQNSLNQSTLNSAQRPSRHQNNSSKQKHQQLSNSDLHSPSARDQPEQDGIPKNSKTQDTQSNELLGGSDRKVGGVN